MTAVHALSALELRDELAAGRLGAEEVAGHFLARIAELNPALGAFLQVSGDAALAEARQADALRAAGGPLGPLHGMPLAHKDLTDVAGIRTTMGSAAVDAWVPEADAALPAVLRRAGAISLGKTQVPEFGLSSYSENLVGPPARNPYDLSRSPGGSSGGSAAAVAAHLLPFAPGSDGGGSIRIPAAATGIIGLKPSRGRVPSGAGLADLGQFVVAGPLARTAADAALMLDALVDEPLFRAVAAPPDPQLLGARTGGGHGPYLSATLRAEGRYRIGISTASPFASRLDIRLEPDAEEALRRGSAALAGVGHTLEEAAVAYDERYPEAFSQVWTAALANLVLAPGREADLTPLTATMRRRALQRSSADLAAAVDILRRFEEDTIRAFSAWDMVLTPTLAMDPRPIGWYGEDADEDYRRQCLYSPFTSLVNVCGLPAISLPVHRTADGLPMGVQLIGRPGAEASLLSVAAQLQADGALRTGAPAPFAP